MHKAEGVRTAVLDNALGLTTQKYAGEVMRMLWLLFKGAMVLGTQEPLGGGGDSRQCEQVLQHCLDQL